MLMLLVWKPHFKNHCSGLEEQAQFGGWRREAMQGNPAGLAVLRTLRCFHRLRLRSRQPVPQPAGPLPSLLGHTSDPCASLPSAGPPRGSAEVPAGVWIAWASPCPGPQMAMEAPLAPLGAVAKAGWEAAWPLAGAWGCHLGLFVEC